MTTYHVHLILVYFFVLQLCATSVTSPDFDTKDFRGAKNAAAPSREERKTASKACEDELRDVGLDEFGTQAGRGICGEIIKKSKLKLLKLNSNERCKEGWKVMCSCAKIELSTGCFQNITGICEGPMGRQIIANCHELCSTMDCDKIYEVKEPMKSRATKPSCKPNAAITIYAMMNLLSVYWTLFRF